MGKNKTNKRILRRTARVVLTIFLLFTVLIFFIRSPWGQDIIVTRVVDYISGKTNTKVVIGKLYLDFSGDLVAEGIYLEDKKGDTLLYSELLEANLDILPLVFNNELDLETLQWQNVQANISRDSVSEKFNYEFLIDALSPKEPASHDPAAEPIAVSLGIIDLNDFLLNYIDEFTGVEARVKVGKLQFRGETTDLKGMVFEIASLNLSNSTVTVSRNQPHREHDSTASPLAVVRMGELNINDVALNYKSAPDSVNAVFNIGEFSLEMPEANLAANHYKINRLLMKNSGIRLHLPGGNSFKDDSQRSAPQKSDIRWPQLIIRANDIELENNSLSFDAGYNEKNEGLDPNHINLTQLALSLNEITYRPESLDMELNNLSFVEKNGFNLEQLSFSGQLDSRGANLSDFAIETANSAVVGEVDLEYPAITEILDFPEKTRARLKIAKINLDMQDAFLIDPRLKTNEYLEPMARAPIKGSVIAGGDLATLMINADIAWGDSSSVAAKGMLKDITRSALPRYSIDEFRIKTSRGDVLNFIPGGKQGLSIPRTLIATGNLEGNVDRLDADIKLSTTYGIISLDGYMQSGDEIRLEGQALVEGLRLDSLLNNEQLGKVGFDLQFSGSGSEMDSMDAGFDVVFSQLEMGVYDFSGLQLNGKMVDGTGDIKLRYKDENLNLSGGTHLDLTSNEAEIKLDLDIIGADLEALGLTREEIRTAFKINAEYQGTGSDFNFDASIVNGVAVYENKQYHLGDFELSSNIDAVKTNIEVKGDILNGSLRSNTSVKGIEMALRRQFRGYFESVPDTVYSPDSVQVAIRFKLSPNPVLDEVFIRDIEKLDSIIFRADYESASKILSAQLDVPSAVYKGSAIDSLHLLVKGNADDLNLSAGLGRMEAGPVHIKQTVFSGNLSNHQMLLDFSSLNGDEQILHIASELDFEKDTIYLHINPDALVINYKEWIIPENNRITIAEKMLGFQDVKLNRAGQNLLVSNTFDATEEEHIGIRFDDFRLQSFLSLLNPEEKLASGSVSGELIIENPFGASGMVSNFRIDDFQVMEKPLGQLSFNGTSQGRSDYGFNMALQGAGADLELKGSYTAAATGALLNLDMALNRLDIRLIESFSNGFLKNSAGYISGTIEVAGTTASPEYEGSLQFNDAVFNVTPLNSTFRVSDELLQLDTKGIYFTDFNLADANGSIFTLDGSVQTADLLNPEFDLKLDAENFRILNSTEEDNKLFYGLANVDIDMSLKGNPSLPRIAGRLRIRKVTDITYKVPEIQLDVQERDGVVIFVNRENPNAILTRNEQPEEGPANFKGMDVEAILEIDKDAEFSIIMDERTGDNLQVSGEGELNLNIEVNGRTSLSGRYELQSGHYETSLYNLVNRRFEISPGSSITWQGDPMDAKLDVTAVYSVETSAAPLMATVTSGQGTYAASQYRQVLPFLVYLNVEGDLMEPELSFDLEMPEDEQGIFGGAVYSRVQQLNQQEAELNKQVFSLLALNRFYPASGSDGSAGGTAAIARDNVNKVLSGELNAFSDRIFGESGFEVNFDLDSFTDYQGETPQDRTQLNINASKKMFDDRLIVTAGSAVDVEGSAQPGQAETPIIGNLSLEYLLTENGRYRLRGFRKSEYENIIEGQLIITGMALIFNREFNEFSDLFSPFKANENKKKKE